MQISNVGVVSPGDMGQAIAACLKESGLDVYTALDGRSPRTRKLAQEAGLADCGSMEKLVATCDMVFSVLNPAAAVETARNAAAAMKATGRKITFVDCNAIAPQTAHEIGALIRGAGGAFVDIGIIGGPPRGKTVTKLYVSGPEAHLVTRIEHPRLSMRVVSERPGDASGVKMCYGSLTKGAAALGVEMLVAARRLGVEQTLVAELKESVGGVYSWLLERMPPMPPKAYRWTPEMLEIAKTFEGAGMTPRLMLGAADMFDMIAATPIAKESPEQARKLARSGTEVVQAIADGK